MSGRVEFHQVPIPNKVSNEHPHQCSKCKNWTLDGVCTYNPEKEASEFHCLDCYPDGVIIPLPKKIEFSKTHECFGICKKKTKKGVLTYCDRCEEAEFVCFDCLKMWFQKISRDDYGYQFVPPEWKR